MALVALLRVAALAQTSDVQQDLLRRPVDPIIADSEKRPLTEALHSVSGRTLKTFIDFGVELDPDEHDQPQIQLDLTPDLTVGQVLDRALPQAPNYDYQVKSAHFVSVAPKRLRNDPADILNLKVARFDVEDAQSGEIISTPEFYIPELKAALHPDEGKDGKQVIYVFNGLASIGPLVTLHLQNVTVRQILDAVSIATERTDTSGLPLGWLFRVERKDGGPPAPHWGLLGSAPGNWKELRIEKAGITMANSIALYGVNDLGVAGFNSGSTNTNSSGQWPDTYYVCSTACPANTTGSTGAEQSWTANGAALSVKNGIVYKCQSITIDGH